MFIAKTMKKNGQNVINQHKDRWRGLSASFCNNSNIQLHRKSERKKNELKIFEKLVPLN